MPYKTSIDGTVYRFADLRDLLAKATPERSGDQLAGIAADGPVERLAAQMALADLPLKTFLAEELIPAEIDDVSRLIVERHDRCVCPIALSGFRYFAKFASPHGSLAKGSQYPPRQRSRGLAGLQRHIVAPN